MAEIEEAVVVEETAMVLVTEYEKPTLPSVLDKEGSLAKIKTAYEKYSGIEIAGTKDKANYDKVVEGLKELKDSRLAWDKAVEENIYAPAKAWYTKLGGDYDAILNDFKAKEAELRKKKDAIDQLKKDEKAADDARKLKVLESRMTELLELGGKKQETEYVFDYDLSLSVKISTLKELSEDKWEKVLGELKEAHTTEQNRIKKAKEASDALLAQATELATANALKQKNLRLKELKMEGFKESILGEGQWEHPIAYPERTITQQDIENMTDSEWDSMIIDYSGWEPTVEATPLVMQEVIQTPIIPTQAQLEEEIPMIDTSVETPYDEAEAEAEVSGSMAIIIELVFTTTDRFMDVDLGSGVTQRIYVEGYREWAVEGLVEGEFTEGTINEELSFILFQTA